MSADRAARDSQTARQLLAEIIREASELSDLLARTTISHQATGPAYYLLNVEAAFRQIGEASREAYRKAITPGHRTPQDTTP